MQTNDHIQPFIFEKANIRGAIVHIEKSYQDILEGHDYPPLIRRILGEGILSCVLLANTIKFKGEISLQYQGSPIVPLFVVQCTDQFQIRGYAKFEQGINQKTYEKNFQKGQMALTIKQHNKPKAYQSIVPLVSNTLSENLMHYFAQSEQLSTRVWLAVGEGHAAGMMLQLMPSDDASQKEQFWEYAVQLGQTVTKNELLRLNNQTLLHRLYHETGVRLFDKKPVQFQCKCNQEKMKQALTVIGQKEIESLLKKEKNVEVNCEFCNKTYSFDPIDITLLFRK